MRRTLIRHRFCRALIHCDPTRQERASADPNPADPQPKPEGQPAAPVRPSLNIHDLKDMSIQKLTQVGKDLNVAGATGMRKQDLIFQILKAQAEQSGFIFSEGVLAVLPDGFGFLRAPGPTYLAGPDDSTLASQIASRPAQR